MTSFEDWVAQNLAAMMLCEPWTATEHASCLRRFCTPDSAPQQTELLKDLAHAFPGAVPPSRYDLMRFFLERQAFYDATEYYWAEPHDLPTCLEPPRFAPTAQLEHLDIPQLTTTSDLAEWLGVTDAELDWFADTWRQHDTTRISDLQHYTYHFLPKRRGPPRLVEAPKPRLKTIQQKILRDILNKAPAHDAAHGFVTGRSCLTAARKHASEAMVIAIDLKDFFPSTRLSRVHRVFRNLGYPHEVARTLTSLCSTSTPPRVFTQSKDAQRQTWQMQQVFRSRHLPQGAPTSPALANLAAWMLDVRLSNFSGRFDVAYTRYADDMVFSGDEAFAQRCRGFLTGVKDIVSDAGYRLHPDKTRIMRRSTRQCITGVIVNNHVNVDRKSFDALKAILHNCAKKDPESQNRDNHKNFRAHLDGRVTWAENVNPMRGAKLRKIFNAIAWSA